jgi:hypothetical protein
MIPEVGGRAALYADQDNAFSFAEEFRELNKGDFREEVIRLGYDNTKRLGFEKTMGALC